MAVIADVVHSAIYYHAEDRMDFTLTLVRHGESEANVRHMLSGWMDVDLTEHGRKELEELRQSVDYPVSEAYYASPLRRCRDTSHILFPYADPIISDDFKEIDFRSLEGWILSSKDEIDAYFESWIEDEPYIDEETMSEVMERGRNALRDCRYALRDNALRDSLALLAGQDGIPPHERPERAWLCAGV